ncbi:glycogen debranching N-terminal domain-containing protein [Sinomonas sp. ASV322]|uniref:glycogen debranching N-terminal domain-containing protein n=1 Tax=Sinomonas sp. ASV322 TaxID=3041920 RepID=UPI0027DDC49F|nr:glycogen debranching N-terminal domain-containing protein [Sinomonas sp. ASV322]MDQ4504640.1 glycogen debranching N-terminal domain-containing protein [Sinomonas sp. ASV322]
MPETLQPFLHDLELVFRAPTQAWSERDGQIRPGAPGRATGASVCGVMHSDVRVLSEALLEVDGREPEPAGSWCDDDGRLVAVGLPRNIDGPGADPTTRVLRARRVEAGLVEEEIELSCATEGAVTAVVSVSLAADLAPMEIVKSGHATVPALATPTEAGLVWGAGEVRVEVEAAGAVVDLSDPARPVLRWTLTASPGEPARASWRLAAEDAAAVVVGAPGPAPAAWREPRRRDPRPVADVRLARFLDQSLRDLDGLRMTLPALSGREFLAAGAPWFFTLFGRDSLWAARFLLPLGTELAEGTLAVLASFQGAAHDVESQEEPGKIMHELRRAALTLHDENISLPPIYYGTVDATPLWLCVLHDAWRAGLHVDAVELLLPHAERALAWVAAGVRDGYLTYLDTSGHGLANQGWKDSGDAVQFRDGRLAAGPISLCEVQAYAYEALVGGASLLEAFGRPGSASLGTAPAQLRDAAAALAERFRADFWLTDSLGPYVAIALDGEGVPVDTVTSNMGHLLGTGLLSGTEEALVARRLVDPELDSGYGLRTLATSSAGYWPLKYHGGSVWAHDTAIAIRGLAASGHAPEAGQLAEGLLRAAESFGYRMPELHAGDPAAGPGTVSRALPYPSACRPQAWSAASAVVVADVLGELA